MMMEQIAQRIAALERQSKALRIIDYYASVQVGAGAPAINASEATFYWDDTNDDLYMNNNGVAGWQLIGGASSIGVHDILGSVHTDTTPAVVQSGDILRGFDPGGGARWQRLGIGANEEILESDGSDVDWVATTNDGAANHSTVLRSSAAGALTLDDYFTIDGGTVGGIAGNELLTVNAAGTFAFSGILGVTVEDGDYIVVAGGAAQRITFDDTNGYLEFEDQGAAHTRVRLYSAAKECTLELVTATSYFELNADDVTNRFRIRDVNAAYAERLVIDRTGTVYINDHSNANMTIGLQIMQDANDDEALNLRSSDVGAVYNIVETNTYMRALKVEGAAGGLLIDAFKDSGGANSQALLLRGFLAENVDITKTNAGRSIVEINGFETDGTSLQNTVADGNVFGIRTRRGGSAVTIVIVDEDGDIYYDGALVNYDEHDDALAARDLSHVLAQRYDEIVRYNAAALQRMGVIGPPDERGRFMISTKKLAALQLGALGQLWQENQALKQRVEALENGI